MRFKIRSKTHVGLESVAVTDIVMNLFLFFFITFSLIATFGQEKLSPLKVDLPSISKGKADSAQTIHEIMLTRKGEILWNQTPVKILELGQKLRDEKIRNERVILRSDRHASVQALVRILEVVRDAGAKNVILQTKLQR